MVNFDGALKDILQRDQPTLLSQLTAGVAVREFPNVELPKVQDRRVDLLLLLANRTLLHIEVQSSNDPGNRMIEYWSLIKRRFPHPLRQVVLYVGKQASTIATELEEDGLHFSYGLTDIRGIKADTLLQSGNHGDLALALLAGGGDLQLGQILKRVYTLRGARRQELLSKIMILSGLRGISTRVEWELRNMGVVIDPRDNPFLMRLEREAVARGAAENLLDVLSGKFGRLPKWAANRLGAADRTQIKQWSRKALTARTIEGVLGKNALHSRRPASATRKP